MNTFSPASARRMRRAVWLIFGALAAAVLGLTARRLVLVWMMSLFGQMQTVDHELHAFQQNTVPAHRTDEGAFQQGEKADDAEPQWVKPADVPGWRAKRAEGQRLYTRLAFAGDCMNGLRLLMAALSLPLIYGAYRLSPTDAGSSRGRAWIRLVCLFSLLCSLGIVEAVSPGAIPGFPPELAKMLDQYSAIVFTVIAYWLVNFAGECCIPYRFTPPVQPQHMPPIAALYVASWAVLANMKEPEWKLGASLVMTIVESYYLYLYLAYVRWTAVEFAWSEHAPPDYYQDYEDEAEEEELPDERLAIDATSAEPKPRRLTEW